MTTTLSTLLNNTMSLISIDQFEEFVDAYPEMEGCYTFCHLYKSDDEPRYDSDTKYAFGEDTIGDTCTN